MRLIRRVFMLLAVLLIAQTSTPAWHDTGHMLVAQVAYLRLSPGAKARVDSLLVTAPGRRPLIHLCAGYYTESCEKTYDPVQIAVWMDDFGGDSLNSPYAPWHYINFNPIWDGIPERTNVGAEPENVLSRINWAINTLRKSTGGVNKTDAETLGFLYHLVGDVHQPLHATTRYSVSNPNGDAGGNGFRVKMPAEMRISNLHSFWDSMAVQYGHTSPKRPLDETGKANILSLAQAVMNEFPAESMPEAKDLDPHTWVVESNKLARDVAYKNITEGGEPSKTYTEAAQKLTRKRVALAGYRLADVLNALFVPQP